MLSTWQVRLFFTGTMCARERSANNTRIFVSHKPAVHHDRTGKVYRPVLQVTIHLGANPSDEEHLIRQRFLAALYEWRNLVNRR